MKQFMMFTLIVAMVTVTIVGCDFDGPTAPSEKQQEAVRAPEHPELTMYYTFGDSTGIDAAVENKSAYPGAKMIMLLHTGRGNIVVTVDTISNLPHYSSEVLTVNPRANYVSRRILLKLTQGDSVRIVTKSRIEWPYNSVAAGFYVWGGGPVRSDTIWTAFKRVR